MSSLRLVREDGDGLYIVLNGQKRRPGNVSGMDHVYDMSRGNLKAGDKVKAHHMSGTDHIKITLDDGHILVWSGEYTLKMEGNPPFRTEDHHGW